jgi:transcriptional regulator with XRE-family HTH domain
MKQKFQHDDIVIEETAVREARRLRLKQAREATGKSPKEVAALVGISSNLYYDLEGIDGELNMVISLGELSKLSSVLGIRTRFIFDGKTEGQSISLEQLCAKIKEYLNVTGMSITDFETRVGFTIAAALDNPFEVFKWNVDCLRFVCEEIGIDWHLAFHNHSMRE